MHSSFLLFFIVVVLIVLHSSGAGSYAVSAATTEITVTKTRSLARVTVDITFGAAPTLSGQTLDACFDLTSGDCWGGLASSDAIARRRHRKELERRGLPLPADPGSHSYLSSTLPLLLNNATTAVWSSGLIQFPNGSAAPSIITVEPPVLAPPTSMGAYYVGQYYPTADIFSAFTNVHPYRHGVNAVVFERFGYPYFVTPYTSILTDDITIHPGERLLASGRSRLLMSNAMVPGTSRFYGRLATTVTVLDAGVYLLWMGDEIGSLDAVELGAALREVMQELILAQLLRNQVNATGSDATTNRDNAFFDTAHMGDLNIDNMVVVLQVVKTPWTRVRDMLTSLYSRAYLIKATPLQRLLLQVPLIVWCGDVVLLGAFPSDFGNGTPFTFTLDATATALSGAGNASGSVFRAGLIDTKVFTPARVLVMDVNADQHAYLRLDLDITQTMTTVQNVTITHLTMNDTQRNYSSVITLINATVHAESIYDTDNTTNDGIYVERQEFLSEQARLALRRDPVVGESATAMPGSMVTGEQMATCFVGEAAMDNLFTDAIMWHAHSDIAFMNACAAQGDGWPAGPVTLSTLFSRFPWPDSICTGSMLGLHVAEMLNMSLSGAGTIGAYNTMLQVSGLRVLYDSRLNSSRVLSIDVWDRSTQRFMPLERLRLYRFAASDYVCVAMNDVMTKLLAPKYRGESMVPRSDQAIQDLAGRYMTSMGAVNHTATGRLVDVATTNRATAAPQEPLRWKQTSSDCSASQTWDAEVGTCIDLIVKTSVPTELLIGIIAGVCFGGLLLFLAFRVLCTGRGLGRLAAAGVWGPTALAGLRTIDIAICGYTCFAVVSNTSTALSFKASYITITAFALIISVIDVVQLIRFMLELLAVPEDAELEPEVDLAWRTILQKITLVSIVVMSCPMIIINAVVMSTEPSIFPMIALCITCFALGFKIARLKDFAIYVLQLMRQAAETEASLASCIDDDDEDLDDVLSVQPTMPSKLEASAFSSRRGSAALHQSNNFTIGSGGTVMTGDPLFGGQDSRSTSSTGGEQQYTHMTTVVGNISEIQSSVNMTSPLSIVTLHQDGGGGRTAGAHLNTTDHLQSSNNTGKPVRSPKGVLNSSANRQGGYPDFDTDRIAATTTTGGLGALKLTPLRKETLQRLVRDFFMTTLASKVTAAEFARFMFPLMQERFRLPLPEIVRLGNKLAREVDMIRRQGGMISAFDMLARQSFHATVGADGHQHLHNNNNNNNTTMPTMLRTLESTDDLSSEGTKHRTTTFVMLNAPKLRIQNNATRVHPSSPLGALASPHSATVHPITGVVPSRSMWEPSESSTPSREVSEAANAATPTTTMNRRGIVQHPLRSLWDQSESTTSLSKEAVGESAMGRRSMPCHGTSTSSLGTPSVGMPAGGHGQEFTVAADSISVTPTDHIEGGRPFALVSFV